MKSVTGIRVLLALAPTIFWFAQLPFESGGEKYLPILSIVFIAPLSLISAGPSLYLAAKAKKEIGWWLLSVYCLSPCIWIGLVPAALR